MVHQFFKAFSASFFLIVGTLAMFEPAGGHNLGVAEVSAQEMRS